MLFIAFLCLLYDSGLKLGRRANEISFNKKSNKAIKSNEDSWYFVRLHFTKSNQNQIISALEKQGIDTKTTNIISKDLFNLYLTPSQAHYITSHNLGDIHEIESDNKVTNIPPKDWTRLTIETINSDDLIKYYQNTLNTESECKYGFQKTTQRTFSIEGTRPCLTTLLPTLISNKKINSITYGKEADELNCRAAGFVQKNTDIGHVTKDDHDGSNLVSIERFLNKQGLDGTGVKVLVSDTYLDTNSTFFYDPNHPHVPFNEFINGHRKIDYISALDSAQVRNNDHGTHTSGSISGRALNDDDSSSYYNGCAPGSRLSFYCDNNRYYPPEEISKVIDLVKPHVSTNSWGLDYTDPLHDSIWDQIASERKDTLFFFAAGNDAVNGAFDITDGYKSLRSPGSAKNMLTVGAAMSVYVDEESIGGSDKKEVYMTDEEDESTFLTKILRWSLSDYESNIGMKTLFDLGRLRVSISRNPYEMTNTTVLVIDNREQFESLSRENPPYFVISTFEFEVDNFSDYKFSHTFPVLYLNNESIPQYESNFLESNYRTSKGYKRADFSSKGTGNLGVMKPDIMCPGVSVVSAKAYENSQQDHKELTIKHGTSMATPICAGASAIVFQYFIDGKYRNQKMTPSSFLVRSFMITCSDPLHEETYPNCAEGHGLLNLGKYIGNGFDNDNSHFLIGDRLKLTEGGSSHLMSSFDVSGKETDLRVTLSYLDGALSADSSAALAIDIDLVVVSPSGKVYRGNMREDNTEEHYSTNEKVIVKKDDVEKGTYEIHVFSVIPTTLQNLTDLVEFAVTVYGSLDNNKNGDFLKFKKATKCIPAEHGECNEETFDNDCYNNYYGRSCQIEAVSHSVFLSRTIIKINPYGLRYVIFYYPPMEEPMSVNYRITPVTQFEPKIYAFYNNIDKGGSEFEADKISVIHGFSSTFQYDPDNLPTGEVYMLAVIYNTSPYPTEFVLTSDVTPYVKPPTDNQPETEPEHVTSPDVTIEPITSSNAPITPVTSSNTPIEPTTSSNVPITPVTSSSAPIEPTTSHPQTVTSPPSDNNGQNSDSTYKKIAVAATIMAGVFCLLILAYMIALVILYVRRNRRNDNSDSVASIHTTLLA